MSVQSSVTVNLSKLCNVSQSVCVFVFKKKRNVYSGIETFCIDYDEIILESDSDKSYDDCVTQIESPALRFYSGH